MQHESDSKCHMSTQREICTYIGSKLFCPSTILRYDLSLSERLHAVLGKSAGYEHQPGGWSPTPQYLFMERASVVDITEEDVSEQEAVNATSAGAES